MRIAQAPDPVQGDRGAQVGASVTGRHRATEAAPRYFFDDWLTCAGLHLSALATAACRELDKYERQAGLRRRKRRPEDQANLEAAVGTVIANLAYCIVADRSSASIITSLDTGGRRTRYDRRVFGRLPEILAGLAAIGLLRLRKARRWSDKRSTISASTLLTTAVRHAATGFADFGRADGEELIQLARSHSGLVTVRPSKETHRTVWGRRRTLIDYKFDTPESWAYRREMAELNGFLAAADVTYVGPEPIDIHRRRLHRSFNLPDWLVDDTPRFNLGGRLFGGWWETLGRAERHYIRIGGERVADLDFRSMFVRLAYAAIDEEPPLGDLYAVSGLEDHRDGVKAATSALLFARGRLRRLPHDIKAALPDGWTAASVRRAILETHPRLSSMFEQGRGLELMFTESQILVSAMLCLVRRGVVALPMHDGLMVPVSSAEAAATVMEEEGKRIAGRHLPVERKS